MRPRSCFRFSTASARSGPALLIGGVLGVRKIEGTFPLSARSRAALLQSCGMTDFRPSRDGVVNVVSFPSTNQADRDFEPARANRLASVGNIGGNLLRGAGRNDRICRFGSTAKHTAIWTSWRPTRLQPVSAWHSSDRFGRGDRTGSDRNANNLRSLSRAGAGLTTSDFQ
jgi:hypothetical protein